MEERSDAMESTTRPLEPSVFLRFRVPLSWIAIIAALGLAFWWSMPGSFTVIGTFHAEADSSTSSDPEGRRLLRPCDTGFLYCEKENVYTFRSWQGELRWNIPVDASIQPPAKAPVDFANPNEFGISPDGHYFAWPRYDGRQFHLKIWHDGNLIAEHAIARMTDKGNIELTVLPTNDGHVFVLQQIPSNPRPPVKVIALCLRDTQVLARGVWSHQGTLSPDGMLFVHHAANAFTWSTVSISGNTMQLTNQHSATGDFNFEPYCYDASHLYPSLFSGGFLMTSDGQVYNANGKNVNSLQAGWQQDDTMSPNSRATLLLNKGMVHIAIPGTHDAWDMHESRAIEGDVTDDGRFAMMKCQSHIPTALSFLENIIGDNQEFIAVYERPGRLRATHRLGSICSWWISPDGHRIITMNRDNFDLTLYRW